MDEDDENDAKMAELDEDSNTNRRRKKRKQPDQRNQEEEEVDDSKKRRKAGGSNVDEQRVKGVTSSLSNFFRVNRVGQVKKEVLLRKMNDEGADMNQEELNTIL